MKVPDVAYVTPAMRYDAEANTMIFERRNPDTGEVAFQVPSAQSVEQRRARTTGVEPPAERTERTVDRAPPPKAERALPPPKIERPPEPKVERAPSPRGGRGSSRVSVFA